MAARQGELHHSRRLTRTDVLVIRSLSHSGALQADLASLFSVTQQTISDILTRKTWKHV